MPVKSENENLVKYLNELGVDINKGNKENETPLLKKETYIQFFQLCMY